MVVTWFLFLCEVSILACALIAGVFLTFSDFVMRSLNAAHVDSGIEVMQMINIEVFKTIFMVMLLGMSALSPVLIGYAYFKLTGPTSVLIMIGAAIYLVGVFAVTLVFNVPMNNHLAHLDYSNAEAAAYWTSTYFPQWTFWNSVRASASAASAVCYLIACIRLVQLR